MVTFWQRTVCSLCLLLLVLPQLAKPADLLGDWRQMKPITPRGYVCYRTPEPLQIDGKADEVAWQDASWTDDFVDIQGASKPKPRFRTRAKMLWDDRYFYVMADLTEPHLWGTLQKKNAVIFYDNDFEVFIDPDGDNHQYYEFEMNTLNTIWELTLEKPYWDGGPAKLGTNLPGLKSAVRLRGTLNDPSDTDDGWSVEIAIPWKGLKDFAAKTSCPPKDGNRWRVNFSRVEWLVDIIDQQYRKIPREAHPEDNWVWSPQGLINMHRPERWGYVVFTTEKPGTVRFEADSQLPVRDLLMEIYHRQRQYHRRHKNYADSLEKIGFLSPSLPSLQEPINLRRTSDGYQATAKFKAHDKEVRLLHVRQDSLIWAEPVSVTDSIE